MSPLNAAKRDRLIDAVRQDSIQDLVLYRYPLDHIIEIFKTVRKE
jgi:hypothetical protein